MTVIVQRIQIKDIKTQDWTISDIILGELIYKFYNGNMLLLMFSSMLLHILYIFTNVILYLSLLINY